MREINLKNDSENVESDYLDKNSLVNSHNFNFNDGLRLGKQNNIQTLGLDDYRGLEVKFE